MCNSYARFFDQPDAIVFFDPILCDRGAFIRGCIIDQQQLPFRESLFSDASDSGMKRRSRVAEGEENRDLHCAGRTNTSPKGMPKPSDTITVQINTYRMKLRGTITTALITFQTVRW